jgi:hypothetical protein
MVVVCQNYAPATGHRPKLRLKGATKRREEMVIWKQNLFPRISSQKFLRTYKTEYQDWQKLNTRREIWMVEIANSSSNTTGNLRENEQRNNIKT